MSKRMMSNAVAGLALVTMLSGTAMAQQGASAVGGAGTNRATAGKPAPRAATPPPAAPPPSPTSGMFSAMSYLNGGDYVGAQATHRTVRLSVAQYQAGVHSDVRYTESTGQISNSAVRLGGQRGATGPINEFLTGHMGYTDSDAQSVGTVQQALEAAQYFPHGIVPQYPNVPLPRQGAGARPTSQLEDSQTAALRSQREAVHSRYATAQRLYNAAIETGNRELQERAYSGFESAGQLVNDLDRAILLSDTYRGTAFTNEADAAQYLTLRSNVAGAIEGTSSTQSAFDRNLADEIRDAHSDGTSRDISAATRAELSAALSRTRERDRAADTAMSDLFSVDTTPEGRAAARARFNQRVDLVPTADEVDAAYFPETTTASRPSARGTSASRTSGAASGAVASAAGDAGSRTDSADAGQPATSRTTAQTAEDNTPPRPVPTTPDYPTVSAEERARISREAEARRQAQRSQAAAAAEIQRQAQQAAAREAAERRAMEERARINDENYRIFQAALRQNAQDNRWRQMIRERFGNGAMEAFADGQVLTVLQMEEIYRDYDIDRSPVIPPARSLSAAGNSLSAAGRSLSAAGTAVVTGFDDYRDPAVQSFYEATRLLTAGRYNQQPASNAELAEAVYNAGDYDIYSDPTGRWGRESGGYIHASLFGQEDEYLRYLTANGLTGLDALLAQPFNVVLTWGAGAYDLDLHMTGPTGENQTDRFHIYYAAAGNLEAFPFAKLIKDCICNSGSEVVLTSALLRGGVYRVSVFNYGDQSANSANLANQSSAMLQIVRGGTAVSVGNGTTIEGGRTIASIAVPNGQFGNTWVAAELDPRNGRITVPRSIVQTNGDGNVR